MPDLFGLPSAEILFTADGDVDGDDTAARALAADPAVTDLLLVTHGWNNDAAGARALFAGIARSLRSVLDGGHVALAGPRSLGIVGVIWPSKEFDVGAGIVGPVGPQDVIDRLDDLRAIFPDEEKALDEAAALVPRLGTRSAARRDFVEQVRSVLSPDPADPAEAPAAMFALPGEAVIDRLAVPATIGPPIGGIFGGALNLLNFATFYAMKERSALVGTAGLAPLITRIADARPGLRLHLAGHSFGARLVSAATRALPAGRTIASLTLLQAAFSHFGFSADWDPGAPGGQEGFFRSDVAGAKVKGPILITHTANDLAVGIAYAAASRIANQVGAGLGGPDDIYGGLGRNGAQRTAEAVAGRLLPVGGLYGWQNGQPHNLLADEFIKDHSDVTGEQVAYALLSVITTG